MVTGDEVFLLLKDASIISATSNQAPGSFYIRGKLQNGTFLPQSEVLGDGDLKKEGQKGWLELSSRRFFTETASQMKQTPYVVGYITSNGFVPDSRELK
jgi:hypothetical protein